MNQIKPDRIIIIEAAASATSIDPSFLDAFFQEWRRQKIHFLKLSLREEIAGLAYQTKLNPLISFEERMIDLVFKHRRLLVEEALGLCQGQAFDSENPDAKGDPYREGQHRGASDCVSMVARLLENEP